MKFIFLIIFLCMSAGNLIAQKNDSAQIYFQNGLKDMEAKLFAIAEKKFSKAIEFNPKLTQAHIQSGRANLQMRKISQALKNFETGYQLEPSNAEVIKELASLYFNNRQFQKAIDFSNKCRGCKEANRILGVSYYNMEDYGRAATHLKKAVEENNKEALVTYTLGRTYLELGDQKSAITHFQDAIENAPTQSRWMYELGLIYYNVNDYKNSLKYFDMALKAGMNQTNDFYENYGFAQIYAGKADEGMKTLSIVMDRKPNNIELLTNIAAAMYETKSYKAAIEYYEKLLTLNPKDANSLFMAGMTFQKMGQESKGKKICDKAIEMDPSLAKNRQKKEMPMGL